VLDNDQPAESLKAFLEGRYKRFIGKDIHTFGYSSDRRKIEVLEDLLPIEFMLPILIAVAGELKLGIPDALTKASGQEPRPSFEEMLGLLVREGSPQKEALKESFKEGINRAIQAALAEKKGALEKTFPEYSKWFQSTIGSLVAAKERLRAESKERAELGSTEEKSSQTETVSSSGDAPEPEQESLT
jgi:hypothetical protein